MTRERFSECFLSESKLTVDGNVIRGVKLLGEMSSNKRRYSSECMDRAVTLYEGANVNLDHSMERGVRNRFAVVENARRVQDGLRGDLVCNPKHEEFEKIKWWAENRPRAIGMSHVVDADWHQGGDGWANVTEIHTVEAVDVVADPATTKGLAEAMDKTMELKAGTVLNIPANSSISITGSYFPADKAKGKLAEQDPTMDATADDHIANAAAAVFKDMSLTPKEKLAKIKALLKITDDSGGETTTTDSGGEAMSAAADETKKMEARQKELAAKGLIFEEAIKEGVPPTQLTGVFLEQLMAAPTDAKRTEWLKARKEELSKYNLLPPPPQDPKQPPGALGETRITGKDLAARLIS